MRSEWRPDLTSNPQPHPSPQSLLLYLVHKRNLCRHPQFKILLLISQFLVWFIPVLVAGLCWKIFADFFFNLSPSYFGTQGIRQPPSVCAPKCKTLHTAHCTLHTAEKPTNIAMYCLEALYYCCLEVTEANLILMILCTVAEKLPG